jgi:hypothetical protein
MGRGILNITSATFRDSGAGCLGAVLFVIFTAGAILGLLIMVWSEYLW